MKLLMIAFEDGRWGPCRIARPLTEAGFDVAALCPPDNALAKTRFVARRFALTDSRASGRLETDLAAALRAWPADLVVPGDEQVVAWLQTLVRRGPAGGLTAAMVGLLRDSLCEPARFDAMLMKSHTLALGRELGVRTPGGATAQSPDEALVAARRIGFPLYVKTSFSWSGQGVRYCPDEAAARDYLASLRPGGGPVQSARAALKRLAGRDWYPTETAIDLQQPIVGAPAMYCAVALRGRLLGGFAGFPVETLFENGPSTIVRLGDNAEMAAASRALVAALGASGFLGFDFMIEASTGAAYLLECNPRPVQVGHLGPRVGVDLCGALAGALGGATFEPAMPDGEATVALFPQEWLRAPAGLADLAAPLDAPWDDPGLLRAMVASDPPSLTP